MKEQEKQDIRKFHTVSYYYSTAEERWRKKNLVSTHVSLFIKVLQFFNSEEEEERRAKLATLNTYTLSFSRMMHTIRASEGCIEFLVRGQHDF